MARDDCAGSPRLRLEEDTNSNPLIPNFNRRASTGNHGPTSAEKLDTLSHCEGIPRRWDSKLERRRCLHCPVEPMLYTPTDTPHYPGHWQEWRLAGFFDYCIGPPSARSRSPGALDCIRHTQDTCGLLSTKP
ncbi:unnamed protein product, partial [Ectocarpus sp. 4 AP-2014]